MFRNIYKTYLNVCLILSWVFQPLAALNSEIPGYANNYCGNRAENSPSGQALLATLHHRKSTQRRQWEMARGKAKGSTILTHVQHVRVVRRSSYVSDEDSAWADQIAWSAFNACQLRGGPEPKDCCFLMGFYFALSLFSFSLYPLSLSFSLDKVKYTSIFNNFGIMQICCKWNKAFAVVCFRYNCQKWKLSLSFPLPPTLLCLAQSRHVDYMSPFLFRNS